MIGKRLVSLLKEHGHIVYALTSDVMKQNENEKVFYWSYKKKIFPDNLTVKPDAVIHLAGANIGNRRWTKSYKQEILDSRIETSKFLLEELQKRNQLPACYVSASGTDYYPNPGNSVYTEESENGNHFPAMVCFQWEQVAELWRAAGVITTILRTPAVLDRKAGILKAFLQTAFLRIIPTTGSAVNRLSWVHLDDICNIYLYALENHLEGIYNCCAPYSSTFGELANGIDNAMNIRSWHPNVPCFILRMVLGERASLACSNQDVSSKKLSDHGFCFQYPRIQLALNELLSD